MEINTSNTQSVKEQLRGAIDLLKNLDIVSEVSYSVFKDKSFKDIHKSISAYFKSIGNQIDRQNFGIIVIDDKRLNESLGYVTTQDEIAGYLALPKVLKQGIIIGMHVDHKGRRFETITIAAPLLIDEKKCYMAVVVKRTSKNFYKVHRVINAEADVIEMN